MRNRLLGIVSVVFALSAITACGSSPSAADQAPKPGRATEARLIRSPGPLRFQTSSRSFTFRIEVPVDEEGRADVSGMRVMGSMGTATREEIANWLSRATFAPAREDGVPVRGVYKMTLKSR